MIKKLFLLFFLSAAALCAEDQKWFYLGGRIGFSPRTYSLNSAVDAEPTYNAFETAAQMSVQLLKNLALQTEVVYSGDVVTVEDTTIAVESHSLMVPVLAKLTFRPAFCSFSFFGGPYFSVPLGQMNVEKSGASQHYDFENPMGILTGAAIGLKAGPEVLFFDFRFGKDMGYVTANNADQYNRFFVSLSFGYEVGIIKR
jgi:hypothetical protein